MRGGMAMFGLCERCGLPITPVMSLRPSRPVEWGLEPRGPQRPHGATEGLRGPVVDLSEFSKVLWQRRRRVKTTEWHFHYTDIQKQVAFPRINWLTFVFVKGSGAIQTVGT